MSVCTSSRDETGPRAAGPHAGGHPPRVGQVGAPCLARGAVPDDEAAARAGGGHAAVAAGRAAGRDDGDRGERVGEGVSQEGQRGEGARAEQEHGPGEDNTVEVQFRGVMILAKTPDPESDFQFFSDSRSGF